MEMAAKIWSPYTRSCMLPATKEKVMEPTKTEKVRMQIGQEMKTPPKNDESIAKELPVQRITKHVGTGKHMRYFVQWYVHRPDVDNVGTTQCTMKHLIARYWSGQNRHRGGNQQKLTPTIYTVGRRYWLASVAQNSDFKWLSRKRKELKDSKNEQKLIMLTTLR